ncbi:MAG TPA: ABC transporter permease [bacterium]|nr:ABC transporter permease [bacterium]
MNGAADISLFSLVLCLLLFIIPVFFSLKFGLKMNRGMLAAAARMILQLAFVGVFLKYVFELNNTIINISWFMLMIITASFSVVFNSGLKTGKFILPMFLAFAAANIPVLYYLNAVVIKPDNIFDARYIIALGGMILGNSLRGNIIALKSFYSDIKKDEKLHRYRLAAGASINEAIRPYIKGSLSLALQPIVATMATIGIVSLPGMMTGQILGGSPPVVAIKYQIVIMTAIFVSMSMSVTFSIFFTLKAGFMKNGTLNNSIFTGKNGQK